MGLDQYLYKVNKGTVEEYEEKLEKLNEKYPIWNEDFQKEYDEMCEYFGKEEITTWRKYYKLDDLMTDLFYEKGGSGDFNCRYVELNEEDIIYIMEDIEEDDDTDVEYTLEILEKCLKYIENGYKIWYSNWY